MLLTSLCNAQSQLSAEAIKTLQRYRTEKTKSPATAEQTLLKHLATKRDASVLFELALLRVHQKRTGEGIELFAEVAKLQPNYPHVRRNLGQLLTNASRHKEAIPHLQAASQQQGLTPQLALLLGQCYLSMNKLTAAENALRIALVGFPDKPGLRQTLAMVLYQQKRYHEAEANAWQLLEENPSDAGLWLIVANARLLTKRPEEACDALAAAVRFQAQPKPEYLLTLGDLYLQLELPQQAAAQYLRAQRSAKLSSKRLLGYAQALHALGHDEQAGQLARQLLKTAHAPEAQLILGQIAVAVDGAAARQHFQAALKGNPMLGEALIALGDIAQQAGKPAEAVAQYRSARALKAWERRALEAEADLHLQSGALAEALKLLELLRQRHPSPRWNELIKVVRKRINVQ